MPSGFPDQTADTLQCTKGLILSVELRAGPGQIGRIFIGRPAEHHLAIRTQLACINRSGALAPEIDLAIAKLFVNDNVVALGAIQAVHENGIEIIGARPPGPIGVQYPSIAQPFNDNPSLTRVIASSGGSVICRGWDIICWRLVSRRWRILGIRCVCSEQSQQKFANAIALFLGYWCRSHRLRSPRIPSLWRLNIARIGWLQVTGIHGFLKTGVRWIRRSHGLPVNRSIIAARGFARISDRLTIAIHRPGIWIIHADSESATGQCQRLSCRVGWRGVAFRARQAGIPSEADIRFCWRMRQKTCSGRECQH